MIPLLLFTTEAQRAQSDAESEFQILKIPLQQ